MTKDYELPKGRRITADFDENGITKVTVQALDSLIGELNYYADKVCDIEQIKDIQKWERVVSKAEVLEQIRAEIKKEYDNQGDWSFNDGLAFALEIIDTYTKGAEE